MMMNPLGCTYQAFSSDPSSVVPIVILFEQYGQNNIAKKVEEVSGRREYQVVISRADWAAI